MAHDHPHAGLSPGRAFGIGIALNLAYIVVEALFGFWTNSLALLADAGHNLSDVLGLLVAWVGYALARRPASERRTYGWQGSTILAALFNALLLLIAVGAIAWESIRRLSEPEAPAGWTIVIVAGVGVLINAATAWLFVKDRKRDLNIQGAFLHMAADAGVSLGVVVAGVGIAWTGWSWLDPTTSLVVAVLIVIGTWGLLKESINRVMQAVPSGVEPSEVREALASLSGVEAVHDLHIWATSTTDIALTAHLVKPNPEGDDERLADAARMLAERFGIRHATLQWERSNASGCVALDHRRDEPAPEELHP